MKQYKLIKRYPGSPTEGTLASYREDMRDYKIDSSFFSPVPINLIENYPEFWKEIKEYPKIVAFKNKRYPDLIFRLNHPLSKGDDWYCQENTWLNFKDDENIIWEVARSEKEVFTIGDKTNFGIIEGFKYTDDDIHAVTDMDGLTSATISVIHKLKTPLFTTEDGVELYNSTDICYWLDLKDGRTGRQPFTHKGLIEQGNRFKYYSTIELAKEAADNKPTFSKKQIIEAIEYAKRVASCGITEPLFKQRLGI